MPTTPSVMGHVGYQRRNAVTLKLLGIAGLVLVLLIPLQLVNSLRQERAEHRRRTLNLPPAEDTARPETAGREPAGRGAVRAAMVAAQTDEPFESYRMVERAIKYGALVVTLVFGAFFLFETLAGLRLHGVHYVLVGAALCLFYLALLAFGEVMAPEPAYGGAAVASSAMVTLYSAAILRTWMRASLIAGLLAVVHSVLYVVLRMEVYALLAGTAALFAALGIVMFCTRKIDWYAQDAAVGTKREAAS